MTIELRTFNVDADDMTSDIEGIGVTFLACMGEGGDAFNMIYEKAKKTFGYRTEIQFNCFMSNDSDKDMFSAFAIKHSQRSKKKKLRCVYFPCE